VLHPAYCGDKRTVNPKAESFKEIILIQNDLKLKALKYCLIKTNNIVFY